MPSPKKQPKLFIFAGANGSGKSTMAQEWFAWAKLKEFVNADEIAKGLSPLNPDGQRIRAGRLFLQRAHELIGKKEDFALETTLSGTTLLSLIKAAKKENYLIRMFYLSTTDVNINIQRIKRRVIEGGHHVPSLDVKRRYKRSIYNLFNAYWYLCDILTIEDTSEAKFRHIATKIGNETLVTKENMDLWISLSKRGKIGK